MLFARASTILLPLSPLCLGHHWIVILAGGREIDRKWDMDNIVYLKLSDGADCLFVY